MPVMRRSANDSRESISSGVIGRLGSQQWGVVSWSQLRHLGFNGMAVSRLVTRGYLVRLYHGVYAVGHEPLRIEGRLLAGVFHAGTGAVLSHTTAAWWWHLLTAEPRVVHLSTRHRPRPASDLRLHRPLAVDRVIERRLPVTPVLRTLLDLATVVDTATLRRALAEAEHRKLINPAAALVELPSGQPGVRGVRRACLRSLPELAAAETELERRFVLLVEAAGLPLPELQVWIEGLRVDALWRPQRLIVEVDGHATHANPRANEKDRRRELILRGAGFLVCRYTWQQVTRDGDRVVDDLSHELAARLHENAGTNPGCATVSPGPGVPGHTPGNAGP